MSSTPAFASTPKVGSATAHATLDTSLTGPTNYATPLTGGASGSVVHELIFQGLGTTVAGVVNVFLHDGSAWSLIDQVLVSAVTSSTTAVAWRARRQYENLFLPSNSWTLRFSQTIAGNQSMIRVSALYGDL